MTTKDKYTEVPDPYAWEVPSVGDARFTWEYDEPRARLLSLYQKGKDKQWDAQSRIDWSLDVDPTNPVGVPDQFHPLFGSPIWEAADEKRRAEFRHHNAAWNFSQTRGTAVKTVGAISRTFSGTVSGFSTKLSLAPV